MGFDPTLSHTGLDRFANIEQFLSTISQNAVFAAAPSGDTTGNTDTSNLTAAIAQASAGLPIILDQGTYYLAGELRMTTGMKLIGQGKYMTTLKRNSNAYGTVIRCDNADNVHLEGFTIDGGLSGFPTNANNGIRIFDSSNVTCRNIKIFNYQTNAILAFVTTPNTKSNVVYDSCECDGTGGANNGFLIVSMDESVIRHCRALNVQGASGPNYGLQLKNQCRYSAIEDGYANNCASGFAFGNDTNSSPSVSECRITGGIAINCTSGFIGSYDDHNVVEGLVVVQQAGNNEAIRFQGNSNNNAVIGTVVTGTPSPKGVVRFDDTCSYNFVELNSADVSGSGSFGDFEGTTNNNVVVVRRIGTNRPANDKAGSSTGTGNQVWVHSKPLDQIRLKFGENTLTENFPRDAAAQATIMAGTSTSATAYFMRVPVTAGMVISNVIFSVTTAGAGMTLSKVGLYSKAGTQLAVSVDQGTNWQSTGTKTVPLSATYTVPADDVIYACILAIGTTLPTVARGGATGSQNTALSGGVTPYGTMATQTDLPSPATIVTSGGIAFAVALS